jgi:hypothetical protein
VLRVRMGIWYFLRAGEVLNAFGLGWKEPEAENDGVKAKQAAFFRCPRGDVPKSVLEVDVEAKVLPAVRKDGPRSMNQPDVTQCLRGFVFGRPLDFQLILELVARTKRMYQGCMVSFQTRLLSDLIRSCNITASGTKVSMRRPEAL